jgi:uncharacterized protein YjdB
MKHLKSTGFIILLIVSLTTVLSLSIYSASNTSINLTRSVLQSNISVGDIIQLDYSIAPESFDIDSVDTTLFPPQEIILLIDHSNNMSSKINDVYKLDIAKQVAIDFINNLKDTPNLKIGIISFDQKGRYRTDDLLNIQSDFPTLINSINSIPRSTGMNIGDGLRLAYYMFKNFGATDSKKHIITISDTAPNYYTQTKTVTETDIVYNYYYGSNVATDNLLYSSKWQNAYTYSQNMMTQLKNKFPNLSTTFLVTHSNFTYVNNYFSTVAQAGNASLISANNSSKLVSALTLIQNSLSKEIALEDVHFTKSFPVGFEIVGVTGALSVSSDKLTASKDIGKIRFFLDSTKTKFIAEPEFFSITVKANQAGTYNLEHNESFIYTDVNSTVYTKSFGSEIISISGSNMTPTIDVTNAKVSGSVSTEKTINLSFIIDDEDSSDTFSKLTIYAGDDGVPLTDMTKLYENANFINGTEFSGSYPDSMFTLTPDSTSIGVIVEVSDSSNAIAMENLSLPINSNSLISLSNSVVDGYAGDQKINFDLKVTDADPEDTSSMVHIFVGEEDSSKTTMQLVYANNNFANNVLTPIEIADTFYSIDPSSTTLKIMIESTDLSGTLTSYSSLLPVPILLNTAPIVNIISAAEVYEPASKSKKLDVVFSVEDATDAVSSVQIYIGDENADKTSLSKVYDNPARPTSITAALESFNESTYSVSADNTNIQVLVEAKDINGEIATSSVVIPKTTASANKDYEIIYTYNTQSSNSFWESIFWDSSNSPLTIVYIRTLDSLTDATQWTPISSGYEFTSTTSPYVQVKIVLSRDTNGNLPIISNFELIQGISIQGINIEQNLITVDLDTSVELPIMVYPSNATNNKLLWNSSDPNIVSVDNTGTITGVSIGTAIITVTSEDGTYKDEIEILVIDPSFVT